MSFKVDHFVINVVDVDKMLFFYTEILLLKGERVKAYQEGKVPFPSVRITENTIIDLFPKKLWEKSNPDQVCRPNLNHFCLSTNKAFWAQLQERLLQYEVPIDDGPVKRWGAHGTGVSMYFRDTEENVIEVRYYEDDLKEDICLLGS